MGNHFTKIKKWYFRCRRFGLHLLKPLVLFLSKLSSNRQSKPSSILFIRIDRIGDMVMSTSALRALKVTSPKTKITVLTSKANQKILTYNPHVDCTIIYPDSINPMAIASFHNKIRKECFDIVIDPITGYDLKPALVAFLTRSSVSIGFDGFGREVLFDRTMPQPAADRHIIDANADLLKLIEVEDRVKKTEIYLHPHEIDRAARELAVHATSDVRWVGIHPGAHYETQRWGVVNTIRFVELARQQSFFRCCLIGGRSDAKLIEAIQVGVGGGIPVFVYKDLRKTIALISRLDALVCNNSGPLHIASTLNIPSVSFMGPTNARRWWPVGPHQRVLRSEGLDCLGCESGLCPKGTVECMRRISPQAAMDALMALLSVARTAPPSPRDGSGLFIL